jgi:hypothetical protein
MLHFIRIKLSCRMGKRPTMTTCLGQRRRIITEKKISKQTPAWNRVWTRLGEKVPNPPPTPSSTPLPPTVILAIRTPLAPMSTVPPSILLIQGIA